MSARAHIRPQKQFQLNLNFGEIFEKLDHRGFIKIFRRAECVYVCLSICLRAKRTSLRSKNETLLALLSQSSKCCS